jgi:hypothetical protein
MACRDAGIKIIPVEEMAHRLKQMEKEKKDDADS